MARLTSPTKILLFIGLFRSTQFQDEQARGTRVMLVVRFRVAIHSLKIRIKRANGENSAILGDVYSGG